MFSNIQSKKDAVHTAWKITLAAAFLASSAGAFLSMVFGSSELALPIAIVGLVIPTACLPWMTFHAAQSSLLLRQANTAIEGLSKMDTTTGLNNRLGFTERCRDAFSKARSEARPLSAVLIDVDHLKAINDQYGFAGGDAVLASVAEVLQINIQNGVDISARYGGAEFALLLPEADYAWASSFAERLRGTLANRPVPFDGNFIPISASFGVASMLPADDDTEQLLMRARQALLQAKCGGRNKVQVAAGQLPIAA